MYCTVNFCWHKRTTNLNFGQHKLNCRFEGQTKSFKFGRATWLVISCKICLMYINIYFRRLFELTSQMERSRKIVGWNNQAKIVRQYEIRAERWTSARKMILPETTGAVTKRTTLPKRERTEHHKNSDNTFEGLFFSPCENGRGKDWYRPDSAI